MYGNSRCFHFVKSILPTPSTFPIIDRRFLRLRNIAGAKDGRKTAATEKVFIDECMKPSQSGNIQSNIQAPYEVKILTLR